MTGLEPVTPCLQSRCSSQLSYIPEDPDTAATRPAVPVVDLLPYQSPAVAPMDHTGAGSCCEYRLIDPIRPAVTGIQARSGRHPRPR